MVRLLSYASVAEILDVSEKTVRRLVQRGLLAPPRKTRVGLRFSEEEVYRFLYAPPEPRQDEKGRDNAGQGGTNSASGEEP